MEEILLLITTGMIIVVIFGTVLIVTCINKPKQKLREYGKVESNTSLRPELTFNEMCQKINTLHAKPIIKTSIGIDVPRLATKIIIKKSDKIILSGAEIFNKYEKEKYSAELTVREVVSKMIELFDGNDMKEYFEHTFEDLFNYIRTKTEGDVSSCFKKLLPIVFPEDCLTISVMKTFTQALFAAAVEYLLPFRRKHQYHDGYTGWNIEVIIESQEINIKHTKGETSYEENGFNFEWCLIYKIDRINKRIISLDLQIDNVQFNNYPNDLREDFIICIDKINAESHLKELN
ncbi:hypothetical protein EHI8A_098600 [Entamoeba histolytica HM-1:IMSS-B]|nr:hypothetical protein EHI8A_098600 [Entamoeba histolytica HM-1:IMSS-B]EMS12856.1 hypothetical protein KM1_227510 [Entamoeba histolytica HM-3:IMSS]GAT93995.1 hypothetical protein CL6EHI_010330 [Entamoeba histolytica]